MLKNYIIIAWRNLLNNKLYSAINIGGLALGMAISFMLLLYVYNEFSYDKFHANNDRLYRVMNNQPVDGEVRTGSSTPKPLAEALLKDYPEFDKVARTTGPYPTLVNYKDKALKLAIMSSDPSLLDMFSFEVVSGPKGSSALADISSVVITQSAAKSLFGDANPLGQTIKIDNDRSYKVGSVIKDQPLNSSFRFKVLMSWKALEAKMPWLVTSGWGNYSFSTFAMLKPGVSADVANNKIKGLIAKYDPNNKANNVSLYPFASLHLYNEFKNYKAVGGRIEYVRLFLMLAIGILLVACINFMNLSTARSERRAREVGVRKAIGAGRFSLIIQFMGESLMMAFFALGLSLIIISLLLTSFSQIIGIKLTMPYTNTWAWVGALALTLVTGLVAGSYPSLFLSSFKPVKVLKGQLISTKSAVRPRQVLVVVQFTFAICLILSSIFIYKQISFIKDKPVGYEQNGLVEIEVEGSIDKNFDAFRRDAISSGAITDAALTSGSITNTNGNSWGIVWPGQLQGEDKIPIDQMVVNYNFVSTFGLTLAQGRDFDRGRPADSLGLIVNEAAVKLMRMKEPLGQIVKWQGENRTIIGVVKDFVWGSPFEPIKPAMMGQVKGWVGGITMRLTPNASVSKSMATVQAIYKKYNPDYPFEYKFTDEVFGEKLNTEQLLGNMATGFTALAIVISCLGLFGLASFSAEQRKKEIGIRKVLGASTANIWFKLSQEFVKLVLVSFVIGACISYYNVDNWLSKYTYHTEISGWVFVVTMLLSVVICLLTVSWQAIKSAWTNPVKNLRSE
ncbi:ABC transporter permease [Mucilaginibacter gynuensis]|uniref:ABC transporter permease n=1 Tax=Mucilaginibacter gynuensis TaxID=1302236 RepID=A0ABP8FUX6_9SPHI